MSDLLSLQRRFLGALRDGGELEGVAPNAARRLEVHRTTIEAGLLQALTNAFPAVRRVIGAPSFVALAREFIGAYLPRHPVLGEYGRDFPTFIAAQPINLSLPYLMDLARAEWMRQEAYLAADAPNLDPGTLDVADADCLAGLVLRLHPATRLVSSPFPVHTIWRLNQADVEEKDIPRIDMSIGQSVLITRRRDALATREISLADATFVRAVASGASLGEAVESAYAIDGSFEVTPALAAHLAEGTFAGQPRTSNPVRASST